MILKRKHRSIVLSQVFLVGGLFVMTSTSLAQSDTWTDKADMLTNRLGLAACVVDGKIYAVGGRSRFLFSTVEAYDATTDTWTTRKSMPANEGSEEGTRWGLEPIPFK